MDRQQGVRILYEFLDSATNLSEFYRRKTQNVDLKVTCTPEFIESLKLAISDVKRVDNAVEEVNALRFRELISGKSEEVVKAYTNGLYDALDLIKGES